MKVRLALGCLGAAALALSACSSSGSNSGSGGGGDIVIGSISSRTGPFAAGETQDGAKAVFDAVNASGGINGHKIKFLTEDDGGNASQSATLARQLVQSDKVMAMVGGESLNDCSSNFRLYQAEKIYNILGEGLSPACFSSPNIAVVSSGPFVSYPLTLYYMSNTLKLAPVCLLQPNEGIPLSTFESSIDTWRKVSGQKLTEITYLPTAGPSSAVAKAKSDGCKGTVLAGVGPTFVSLYKTAAAQGLIGKPGTAAVGFPLNYNADLPKQLGSAGTGLHVLSVTEPFTSASTNVKAFESVMKAHGVAADAATMQGYIAANAAVAALKTVKGAYTRETVGAAFKAVNYSTPLLAQPFRFVPQANRSGKFVTLTASGTWDASGSTWVTLPKG